MPRYQQHSQCYYPSPSSQTSTDVDEDLDVVVLVVDKGVEALFLDLVETNHLGDHPRGLDLALGDGLDDGLEVAQVKGSAVESQ